MGLWAWSRFEIAHKMESCKVVQTPFPTLPISTRRPPLHLPRRNGLSLVKLGPARLFECQKFTSRMRSTGITPTNNHGTFRIEVVSCRLERDRTRRPHKDGHGGARSCALLRFVLPQRPANNFLPYSVRPDELRAQSDGSSFGTHAGIDIKLGTSQCQ